MTIYQLHKRSGQYSSYSDEIIGSFLFKEKAELEKLRAEQEEKLLKEKSEKCRNCPFLDISKSKLSTLIRKYGKYCSNHNLEQDDTGCVDCNNFFLKWDDTKFEITELDVIE